MIFGKYYKSWKIQGRFRKIKVTYKRLPPNFNLFGSNLFNYVQLKKKRKIGLRLILFVWKNIPGDSKYSSKSLGKNPVARNKMTFSSCAIVCLFWKSLHHPPSAAAARHTNWPIESKLTKVRKSQFSPKFNNLYFFSVNPQVLNQTKTNLDFSAK